MDQFPGERPAKDGRAGVKMLSKCAATDGLQAVCFGQVAQSGELEPEIDPVDQFPSERPARGGRAGVKMLSKCAATDGLQAVCFGQVAQSVEQGTENPCVGGSIPPLATINILYYNDVHKHPCFNGLSWRTHGALTGNIRQNLLQAANPITPPIRSLFL